MRFDPEQWQEIGVNSIIEATRNLVKIKADHVVSVFVTNGNGVQALGGSGHEVTLTVSDVREITVTGPAKARVFIEQRTVPVFVSEGEVWSNSDRRPMESESVLEVTRALRAFKLEQRAISAEMKRQSRALFGNIPAPAPEPEPEPAPEPELEPEPVPDAPQA